MPNKIRKLIPMMFCLIIALSIVMGMGNFALAGEEPNPESEAIFTGETNPDNPPPINEKNDGKRVVKSFQVSSSKPETNLLKTSASKQEPPLCCGSAGGFEGFYPKPVITEALDGAYPVDIISSEFYYGNKFYLQFTGLADEEDYQVTITGAGFGDEGLTGKIAAGSEDYNWNIEQEPVKGVLFELPEGALFYGENVFINVQVAAQNGEGAGLFLSPVQIETRFVIDTGRAYGRYFRAQTKELDLEAVIPGCIAEGTKVNAYLLNSQNEIVATDIQRIIEWDEIFSYSNINDVDPRYSDVFGDFGIDEDETRTISREETILSNIWLYKMGEIPAGQYDLKLITDNSETFIITEAVTVVEGTIINALYPGYVEGYPPPALGGDTLYVEAQFEGAQKDDLNLVVKNGAGQVIGNTVGSRYLDYYIGEKISCVYKLKLENGTVFTEDQEYEVEITRKDGGALYNAECNTPLYPTARFSIYRHILNHGLDADFTFKSVNNGGKTYTLSLEDYDGELSTVVVTPEGDTFTVQFKDPENENRILQLKPRNFYTIKTSVEDDGTLEEIDLYWFYTDDYDYEGREDIYIPEVIMDEMKTYLKENDTSGVFAFDFAILADEFNVDTDCRFKVVLSLPISNDPFEVEGEAVTTVLETKTFGDYQEIKKDYVRLTGNIPLEGALRECSGSLMLEYTNKDDQEDYIYLSFVTVIKPEKVYADFIYGSFRGDNTFYAWMYLLGENTFDNSKFTLILKNLLGDPVFEGNLDLEGEQEENFGNPFFNKTFTVNLPEDLANSYYVVSIQYDGKDIYNLYTPERLFLSGPMALKLVDLRPILDFCWEDDDDNNKVVGIKVSGAKEDTGISAELYDRSDIDNFAQIAAVTLSRDNDDPGSYFFTKGALEGVDLSQKYQIVYLCNGGIMDIDNYHMLSYKGFIPPEKDFDNTISTARTEVWKAINAGTASSASVAIMDSGKLIYTEGFGMADREKNIPADQNTVFNIGSVSKTFVATSIMLLADEGKVALDNPVTDYLPEFTMLDERYKDITVRMLLNHSSGLPGSTFWNNLGSGYNQDIYDELFSTLSRSTLKHRPGELAAYCNDGFTLAEMIVVKVTGQEYGEFLAERIFKPLAMNHTGLGVGRLLQGMIPARYYRPDGKAEPLEVVSLLASGGLSSTTADLCRFAASFAQSPAILSAQSQVEMLKRQPSELQGKLREDSFPFGLGWDYTDITPFSDKNLRLYGKTGGTGHYAAMLYTVPSLQISVAVLANGAQCDSPGIALEVLSAYLQEKGLIAEEEKVAQEPAEAQPLPSGLKAYEGYYDSGINTLLVTLDDEKGLLSLYLLNGSSESVLFSAVYNDGFFYSGGNKYYFTTADGTRYFVGCNPNFNYDMIVAEKLQIVTDPLELAIPMNGKVWLRRNVKAIEGTLLLPTHVVTSSQMAGLPGYVHFSENKIVRSSDYAGMPVKSMRDLTELILVEQDGATWAWLSGAEYMPAELAQTLNRGANTLTIGGEGRNEWLKVGFDATLSFKVPPKGRVIVFGKEDILYDSMVDSGEVAVPAGTFLEFAGNPGDLLQVTAVARKIPGPDAGGGDGGGKAPHPPQKPSDPPIYDTPDPGATVIFTDIANYGWAREAITALTEKGIIKGVGDTSFAPAKQIKRGDCILLIVKLLGVTAEVKGNFADVANDKYYYKEIGIARGLGLTAGVDGTNFQPEASITRQDMFVLAYRALQQQGLINTKGDPGVLDRFSDSTGIAPYAREALAALISMDLVKGSENRINPKGKATRAEAAAFLYRLSSLL